MNKYKKEVEWSLDSNNKIFAGSAGVLGISLTIIFTSMFISLCIILKQQNEQIRMMFLFGLGMFLFSAFLFILCIRRKVYYIGVK